MEKYGKLDHNLVDRLFEAEHEPVKVKLAGKLIERS